MLSTSCMQVDHSWGPTLPARCHGHFDLTVYFEQIWLSILPSVLFLLVSGPRLWQLLRASVVTVKSRSHSIKLGLISLLIILQLSLLPLWACKSSLQTSASIPAAVFSLIAALILAPLSHYEHQRSVRPSTLLSIYIFFSVLFDAVQVRSLWLRGTNAAIAAVSTVVLAVKLVIIVLEGREKRTFQQAQGGKLPPESTSSIYNRTAFWWLNRLFLVGYKESLSLDDLYPLASDMTSAKLAPAIEKVWMNTKQTRPYALLRTTATILKWPLLSPVLPRIALIGFKYCQPLLLESVVNYVQLSDKDRDRNVGYGLLGATGLVYIGIAVSSGLYNFKVYRCTTMIRGSLVGIIYRKTLKLHLKEVKSSAALTLASSDVDRIGLTVESAHEIWASSIETILALILLQRQLGWACIAPVFLALMATAANTRIAKYIPRRQREWGAAIQKRVTFTSSVLRNMKSVKMMGLQDTIVRIIQNARVYELDLSKRYRSLFSYMSVISTIPLHFSAPLAFVIYIYGVNSDYGHDPVAAQIFASLSLTQLLATPLQKVLTSIPSFAGTLGSFHRIQAYIQLDDRVDGRETSIAADLAISKESLLRQHRVGLDNYEVKQRSTTAGKHGVLMQAANISYSADSHPILRNQSLEIRKGLLNVITGPVGCGKTTLLNALLGEITISGGKIMMDHCSIAFCQQTPWLINASIRENILIQSPYDEAWYKRVIWSCALDEDIEQLPDRDYTIVGSRGVSLSGGQKQRLTLARAVYARAPSVALDDTLSALDARTEELVFDRLFSKDGLFRRFGTTVILVTHSVQHLQSADNIIVLNPTGCIEQQGSFAELITQDGAVQVLSAKRPSNPSKTADRKVESAPDVFPPGKTRMETAPSLPRADATTSLKRSKPISDSAVLVYYLKSIGWYRASVFIATSLAYVICTSFTQIWVQWWTESKNPQNGPFLGVYFALAVGAITNYAATIWCMMISIVPISAARLHWQLLDAVIHAPMSFFSTVDSGMTLNRFSQDMSLINSRLPVSMMQATPMAFQALAQIVLIAIGSTYMAGVIPFCLGTTWVLQRFYLRTSRQLRLLDLEQKSPLFSSISETLEGLPTIRALDWQGKFERRHQERLDASQRPVYLLYCIQRWLNFVLDLIVAALAILLVALVTNLPNSTSGSRLGVAMLNILGFSQSLAQFIFFYTDLETSLQAVSRVKEFVSTTVSEEADASSLIQPPASWPARGAVEFRDTTASYTSDPSNPSNPSHNVPALQNLSLTIQPGQKVGICGRTGSGKSSLLSALFRMLELNGGNITVDGLDLRHISRKTVRTRLIAIPQDPFLIPGTVRLNMALAEAEAETETETETRFEADPVTPDSQIITALTKVGLWEQIHSRGGLDADMDALALSHGQQQLFCLARAMLRRGTIVVLDEATSHVDWATDELVQRVIRAEFARRTIVTVAHRLRTILDSDVVVVLGEGRVLEAGHPGELLARAGPFRELCGIQGITIDSISEGMGMGM